MSKQICLEYDEKEYTLEFTRNSVKKMESRGFVFGEIETKPVTRIPELFAGAFLAHHNGVDRETIDKIYGAIEEKDSLIGALVEMYADTINTLMEKPEKNGISWVKSW